MRILFFTDTHLRSSTPQGRTDDLREALAAKLTEVVTLANEREVDAVVHGGDLFDTANPGLAAAGDYIEILGATRAPLYIVAGNHDIYGGNMATLPRTLLGLLVRLRVFTLLKPKEPVFLERNGIRLQLTGSSYHYDIDRGEDRPGYVPAQREGDVTVHVAHGMLLPERGFPGEYTLVEDIEENAADVTLVGHYHLGFPAIKRGQRYFVNPGALARLTNHPREITRRPAVTMIEVDSGISIEEICLQAARPGPEVLSREELEEAQARRRQMEMFASEIRAAADMKRVNVERVIEDILAADSSIPDAVRREVRERLSLARITVSGGELR